MNVHTFSSHFLYLLSIRPLTNKGEEVAPSQKSAWCAVTRRTSQQGLAQDRKAWQLAVEHIWCTRVPSTRSATCVLPISPNPIWSCVRKKRVSPSRCNATRFWDMYILFRKILSFKWLHFSKARTFGIIEISGSWIPSHFSSLEESVWFRDPCSFV